MIDRTGRRLETEVYDCLASLLQAGTLGLDPRTTCVYRHKKYYSDVRKAEIEVDVALEITMPGADAPILIWIWECKDYSSQVSVHEVEEFDSKLQQIGANNTKGTMVTRNGFQKSSIEYARSRKIGLARLIDKDQITMILYSPTARKDAEYRASKAMTLCSTDKDDVRFAGLGLNGDYIHYYAFDERPCDSLTEYVSDQLFFVLPDRTDDVCLCCLVREPVSVFRVKFLFTASTSESDAGAEGRKLSCAPIRRSLAVCAACANRISALPRREDQALQLFRIGFLYCIGALAIALLPSSLHGLRPWQAVGAYVLLLPLILVSLRWIRRARHRRVLAELRKTMNDGLHHVKSNLPYFEDLLARLLGLHITRNDNSGLFERYDRWRYVESDTILFSQSRFPAT